VNRITACLSPHFVTKILYSSRVQYFQRVLFCYFDSLLLTRMRMRFDNRQIHMQLHAKRLFSWPPVIHKPTFISPGLIVLFKASLVNVLHTNNRYETMTLIKNCAKMQLSDKILCLCDIYKGTLLWHHLFTFPV
jgi:hypothetical protein